MLPNLAQAEQRMWEAEERRRREAVAAVSVLANCVFRWHTGASLQRPGFCTRQRRKRDYEEKLKNRRSGCEPKQRRRDSEERQRRKRSDSDKKP